MVVWRWEQEEEKQNQSEAGDDKLETVRQVRVRQTDEIIQKQMDR